MTEGSFEKLSKLFDDGEFTEILKYANGQYFFKLRSMSRTKILKELCAFCGIRTPKRNLFQEIFNEKNISEMDLDKFANKSYTTKLDIYNTTEDTLYVQLYKMHVHDWGGLYQNGLEKTIVDKYVKKIVDYNCLETMIGGKIHESMSGYVKTSWYNHWTTILIENMFKSHSKIFPAIGQVKNLDFFWNNIPFDLKVTYLPDGYISEKRKQCGLRGEQTLMQEFARKHDIPYDHTTKSRHTARQLITAISESQTEEARSFMEDLQRVRTSILNNAVADSHELATWLYANQGTRRFDRAYRLYLVLVDINNFEGSWKMKRNRDLVPQKIAEFLSHDPRELLMDIQFLWERNLLKTKCVLFFIIKNTKSTSVSNNHADT